MAATLIAILVLACCVAGIAYEFHRSTTGLDADGGPVEGPRALVAATIAVVLLVVILGGTYLLGVGK